MHVKKFQFTFMFVTGTVPDIKRQNCQDICPIKLWLNQPAFCIRTRVDLVHLEPARMTLKSKKKLNRFPGKAGASCLGKNVDLFCWFRFDQNMLNT
jgi:hypothetical protein